ncbi:hypothetical protein ALP75_205370 [Pseudomonas syringae pv. actinidiae]|nr:hypothetical protein ALP75_205370 [Pseudomonas syringae pv. actinidiae]
MLPIDTDVGRENKFLDTFRQDFPFKRHQLIEWPPVVLQAARQSLLDIRRERAHRLQASCRVTGENDDAVLVADKGFQARPLPALFECFKAYLDDRNANDAAFFLQPVSQVIARLAGGGADPVKTPRQTAHRILEIGAERQVFTLITVGVAPVAGRQHATGGVQHIDGTAAAAPVHPFEVKVDLLLRLRTGVGQQLRHAGFKLQHAGQVGVLADFALYRPGVQLKLAFAAFAQRLDAIVLADQIGDIAQPDHQHEDQRWQKQLANQTGFHGE